eukprot:6214627-Pleurochrysis_carterae.AAC.1
MDAASMDVSRASSSSTCARDADSIEAYTASQLILANAVEVVHDAHAVDSLHVQRASGERVGHVHMTAVHGVGLNGRARHVQPAFWRACQHHVRSVRTSCFGRQSHVPVRGAYVHGCGRIVRAYRDVVRIVDGSRHDLGVALELAHNVRIDGAHPMPLAIPKQLGLDDRMITEIAHEPGHVPDDIARVYTDRAPVKATVEDAKH